MGIQEFVEIVKQLIGRKIVNPAVEVIADTTHRSAVGLDGLGLQAVKLQAFQVLPVVAVELWIGWHVAVHSNLLQMESDRLGKAFLHCRLGFINKKPRGYYFQQKLPTGCLPRSGFVQQQVPADVPASASSPLRLGRG